MPGDLKSKIECRAGNQRLIPGVGGFLSETHLPGIIFEMVTLKRGLTSQYIRTFNELSSEFYDMLSPPVC